MKIIAMSDSHWKLEDVTVPKGDVFVFAGDWSAGNGSIGDAIHFASFVKRVPCEHKIIIAGNHDWVAQREPNLVKLLFKDAGATYLFDEGITIDGINFWGSPWSPEFMNWAFMKPDYDLAKIYRGIKRNTDVLITHTPPYGIRDFLPTGENVGSQALEEAVRRVRPSVHIFGHIHGGHGTEYSDDTIFYNVSVCDDDYNLVYKPTEVIV